MKLSFLGLAALSMCCACVATAQKHSLGTAPSQQAFEALKSLEGRWQGTVTVGTEQTPVELSYEVVSGGSVVMERLFAGSPHEMVSMYHADGGRLLMTHYCAIGNQPRMELNGWTPAPEATMSFSFVDATNRDSESGLVMHDMRLSKISNDHISSSWTAWKDGKPDHTANFEFQREPGSGIDNSEVLKALGYSK
jgi:hypothetical protein